MRYIVSERAKIPLAVLAGVLQAADSAYAIEHIQGEPCGLGELTYAGTLYAQLEIHCPSDEFFAEEVAELQDFVSESQGKQRARVAEVLRRAQVIVAAQILFQGEESGAATARMAPVWHWLFDKYPGLLQVDGKGYYDRAGLILKVE
ncbi:MAG: hypothetical protein EXR62_17740 [Chloroflexi bacterium]|nr:hypothetical protein [Chloroflexota bacterium]